VFLYGPDGVQDVVLYSAVPQSTLAEFYNDICNHLWLLSGSCADPRHV